MQVESNIPAPPVTKWKADLSKLYVNQSVRVTRQHIRSVRSMISGHFHKDGLKAFTTARESDGSFRVWRIK